MPTALLVDDQVDVRFLMRIALESAGFETIEAGSGPDALAALAHGARPDLVVLDVQMPEMDGWTTLEAIRGDPATAALPVLMCSVKARPEDVQRGCDAGCDGYLTKPFDVDELVEQAGEILSRARQR
jgi:CheY-like chemotaxis protein